MRTLTSYLLAALGSTVKKLARYSDQLGCSRNGFLQVMGPSALYQLHVGEDNIYSVYMNLCIVVRDTVGFDCTLFPLQDPIHAQLVVIGGSECPWRRLGFYPNPHASREKPGRELFEVSVMNGDKAWMEDTQWGDPSRPPGKKTTV